MNNTYQIDTNEKPEDIINKPILFIADLSTNQQFPEENNINDTNFQSNKIKNLIIKSNNILYCPINNSHYNYDFISQNINNLYDLIKNKLLSNYDKLINTTLISYGNNLNKDFIFLNIFMNFIYEIFNIGNYIIKVNDILFDNYNSLFENLKNKNINKICLDLLSKEKVIDTNNIVMQFTFLNLNINENNNLIDFNNLNNKSFIFINFLLDTEINSLIQSLDYIDMIKKGNFSNKNLLNNNEQNFNKKDENIKKISNLPINQNLNNNNNEEFSNPPSSGRKINNSNFLNSPLLTYQNNNNYNSNNFNFNNNNNEQEDILPLNKSIQSAPTYLPTQNNMNFLNKINDLDKSVNLLNNQHENISRVLEKINNNNNNSNQNNFTPESNFVANKENILSNEVQKLKNEHSTLMSDNLIYREDINNLNEMNRHLESQLKLQRDKYYDLVCENDKLNLQNLSLNKEIDIINNKIAQIKFKEKNYQECLTNKMNLENNLKSLQNDFNEQFDIKTKLTIEYQTLLNQFNDLCNNNCKIENEINLLEKVNEEKISQIENKLTQLICELDNLKKENFDLRNNNNELTNNLIKINNLKTELKDNYNKEKYKNDYLNAEIEKIKKEFLDYKSNLEKEEFQKEQEKILKKNKLENKVKIINDLQNRIKMYKNEKNKNNSNNIEYNKIE